MRQSGGDGGRECVGLVCDFDIAERRGDLSSSPPASATHLTEATFSFRRRDVKIAALRRRGHAANGA